MKKFILSISCLIFLFLITGCGENQNEEPKDSTPKDELLESLKPLSENCESMTMTMKTTIEGSNDEEKTSQNIELTILDDIKNKKSYTTNIMNIGSYENKMEVYTTMEGEKEVAYSKGKIFGMGTDEWTKSDNDATTNEEYDLETFENAINKYNIKKVDSDISGSNKYIITIPKNEASNFLDETSDQYTYESDIEVMYYVKDKTISKIIMDLTNSIKSSDMKISKYEVIVEISNVNNTTVNIPAEVLSVK